ncbi:MAG: hypothetical protein HZB76_04580 [Chlamydiae bacterium]|nr:hypothetical protein [Chlamydiota bacterium]
MVTVIGSSCKYFPATSSQIDEIKKQLENSWSNYQKENKEAPTFRDVDRFECKWHLLEDRSTIDSDQNPSIFFIRKGKPVENVSWSLSNICFSGKINLVAKEHLCDELKEIISSGGSNRPLLTTKV